MRGPIAVEGAEPDDTLEIRIDAIEPGADWSYNVIRPLAGTLPQGTELSLTPFFRVVGVAPPAALGTIGPEKPRLHGGNIDNRQLVAGSQLFLPMWVPGACFSVGDGEVCVTALELCLNGRFTFVLHKQSGPFWHIRGRRPRRISSAWECMRT